MTYIPDATEDRFTQDYLSGYARCECCQETFPVDELNEHWKCEYCVEEENE